MKSPHLLISRANPSRPAAMSNNGKPFVFDSQHIASEVITWIVKLNPHDESLKDYHPEPLEDFKIIYRVK